MLYAEFLTIEYLNNKKNDRHFLRFIFYHQQKMGIVVNYQSSI